MFSHIQEITTMLVYSLVYFGASIWIVGKSNMLDTIIIIIRFLPFLLVDAVFRLHFKPENFLHMYESPRFFFVAALAAVRVTLVASLVFTQRKRGESIETKTTRRASA